VTISRGIARVLAQKFSFPAYAPVLQSQIFCRIKTIMLQNTPPGRVILMYQATKLIARTGKADATKLWEG
jgi:hypothetical protein